MESRFQLKTALVWGIGLILVILIYFWLHLRELSPKRTRCLGRKDKAGCADLNDKAARTRELVVGAGSESEDVGGGFTVRPAQFVKVRGQSWITANIGVASIHYQWDTLIKRIFDAINTSGQLQPDSSV